MDEPLEPLESFEPIRPNPTTPTYLPRLWKSLPEPEDEVDVAKKKKQQEEEEAAKAHAEKPRRKKKKKKVEVKTDDGTGAVKLEETPVFDTYEARQRARWLIGGLLATIGLIGVFIALRAFKGNGAEEEIREGEPPPPLIATRPRPNLEFEARSILNNAKLSSKKGKNQVALDLLNKVAKNYPGTAAAREALSAIERNRQSLPLFSAAATVKTAPPKSSNPGMATPTGPSPPPASAPAVASVNPTNPTNPINPTNSTAGPTPPRATSPTQAPAPIIAFKPLPRGFRAKPGAPIHDSGWPTRIICDRDSAEMVLVPEGTFLMGREDGDPVERPAHPVRLSTYYIDQHEVTVRQFIQFLKDSGRPVDAARLSAREATDPISHDDLPVVNLSAREAKAYCHWAKQTLPTEAQWEMAARSTDGRISYWNGELPRKDPPKGARPMEPVMTLASDRSPYGAFDLGANAWEWTSEYYESKYYKQFRDLVLDPTGPRESPAKIVLVTVKGGSKSGILTWREGLKIETRLPYLGFRGALSVEGAPSSKPTAPAPNSNPALPGGVQPF